MPRSSTFLREQQRLTIGTSNGSFVAGKAASRLQTRGFHVVKPAKPMISQEDQKQFQYAQFLAEDAEKHPEKLIPFIVDMLAKAKSLLKDVKHRDYPNSFDDLI
jgi:hypothetical protein